jgi:hypothetical protein
MKFSYAISERFPEVSAWIIFPSGEYFFNFGVLRRSVLDGEVNKISEGNVDHL